MENPIQIWRIFWGTPTLFGPTDCSIYPPFLLVWYGLPEMYNTYRKPYRWQVQEANNKAKEAERTMHSRPWKWVTVREVIGGTRWQRSWHNVPGLLYEDWYLIQTNFLLNFWMLLKHSKTIIHHVYINSISIFIWISHGQFMRMVIDECFHKWCQDQLNATILAAIEESASGCMGPALNGKSMEGIHEEIKPN